MRSSLWVAALFVGLSVAWAGEPKQGGEKPKKERAEQLIKQLNSNKFADRERASAELEKLGLDALEPLKKVAAAKDTDQETRSRAEKLVARLSEKLESEIILTPTRLRLNLKDTPVTEAVKQLAKQSGYSIVLQGDVSKLAGRKITLDTGETTFWQAFDQLCDKGGLVAVISPYVNVRPGMPGINGPVGVPQFQPLPLPARERPVPPPPVKDEQAQAPGAAALLLPVLLVAEKRQLALPVQAPGQPALQPVVGGFRPGPMGGPAPTGQIMVTDGKAEKYPTHYAGAVRFRLVPYDRASMGWIREKAQGETLLVLEVCAEPKLANFHVSAGARVDKAAADQGQSLSLAPEQIPAAGGPAAGVAVPQWQQGNVYAGANRALLPVRLKRGEKQAKALKELAGSVTAECLSPPQVLLAIDDVLKAAGKSAKGKDGASLELVEITKQDSGEVRLRVRQETTLGGVGGVMPGGAMRVQFVGGPRHGIASNSLPELVDAKGKAFRLVQIPSQMGRGNGNVIVQEMTMVFRPAEGQGEPARLVLQGRRTANVRAAFTFTDVPLP